MNEELDGGPVSNIYKIKIDQNQNAEEISENIRHNVSSFRALNWKPYFKTLKRD